MNLSLIEEIVYSIVRIEAIGLDGNGLGTGTGFILDINETEGTTKPILITNRHVAEISSIFRLVFCTSENDEVDNNKLHSVVFTTDQLPWILHPEDGVDLAAIPLAQIYLNVLQEGVKLFFRSIGADLIPDDIQVEQIDVLEEITMIGYPNGLWDSVNNKPLIRRGVTATHYNLDYCGKKEFLIDCACFPGSSGSPVFILQRGTFADKFNRILSGNRVLLLGILYAGPQFNAQGNMQVIDIQTAYTTIINSSIPMNLGVVIKSTALLAFKQLI